MTNLEKLRSFIAANPAELDVMMREVYAALTEGLSDFAIVDAGAHKGWHTLEMLKLPGCARIYVVEADPWVARPLVTNLSRWHKAPTPRLDFRIQALQDRPDLTEIAWLSCRSHDGRSSIRATAGSLQTIWDGNPKMSYRPEITVPCTTVDAMLADTAQVLPFIKLDLMGGEFPALRGAAETLRTLRPVVSMENSDRAPEVHGFDLSDVLAFLDRHGYVALDYAGAPMTVKSWFDFFQIWLVPGERMEEIQKRIDAAVQARIGPGAPGVQGETETRAAEE